MITPEQEILDAMNDLEAELEDLGPTFIDLVIDSREDDGLPPLTPEELASAQSECDANADRATAIESAIDDLRLNFFELVGKFPHWSETVRRYSYPW